MTLRVMGADGIGELSNKVSGPGPGGLEAARGRSRSTWWSSRPCPPSSSASSRPPSPTPAEIDRANLYARKALFASGDAVVAGTKVGGRHYLEPTLLNPETTADDIAAVLDLIAGHAEQYLGESLDRAS